MAPRLKTLAQDAFNRLPLSDSERSKTVLVVIARAEHEVGFHAGAQLQPLLPQPATSEKLREQVALYINGLRPDLGIHGAVHYLFRVLRGDMRVGTPNADENLEEMSLRGRGAAPIFALFIAPISGFLRRRPLGYLRDAVWRTALAPARHGRGLRRRRGESRH